MANSERRMAKGEHFRNSPSPISCRHPRGDHVPIVEVQDGALTAYLADWCSLCGALRMRMPSGLWRLPEGGSMSKVQREGA